MSGLSEVCVALSSRNNLLLVLRALEHIVLYLMLVSQSHFNGYTLQRQFDKRKSSKMSAVKTVPGLLSMTVNTKDQNYGPIASISWSELTACWKEWIR